jgi:microcystin degradation protein MlrC
MIGRRLRYDGSDFDPTATNAGEIEIVHRYTDSGNLTLTSQNPEAGIYNFRAHGSTLINLFREIADPEGDFSDEEKKELLDDILMQIKAAYGDSVTVDFENGDFQAAGDGPDAEKVAYLRDRVEMALNGNGAPNTPQPEEPEAPSNLPGM